MLFLQYIIESMSDEVVRIQTEMKKELGNSSNENKRKRGAFPRLSFKKTIELAETIYELGQGEPVRRLKVFDYLKKSPESGPSRMLVTTSAAYDLTVGSYQAEYLSVTGRGQDFITASSKRKKLSLALDILFSNEIFNKFVEYWKDKGMPSDDIAADWLLRNCQLTAQDAKACWEVIKDNVIENSLVQELSGKNVIVSKDVALEATSGDSDEQYRNLDSQGELSVEEPRYLVPEEKRAMVNAPKPFGSQVVERDFRYGRARLVLPAEMTKEEIQKIKSLIDSLITEVET